MKKPAAQTYQDITVDFLRNKLKLKQLEAKAAFSKKFPHVEKFLREKGLDLGKIREHSARIISAGALTGTLFLAPPANVKSLPSPLEIVQNIKDIGKEAPTEAPQKILIDSLAQILPDKPRPLTHGEEKTLEQVFENVVGIKTKGTLEGEHLNTTYGYIGAEQHLRRYPGDSVANHEPYLKEGMAPGLGAWGYFAPTKSKLTPDLEETEKWYSVAQTLYLSDWAKRQPYLRDWYKYRKFLIVNTSNGNAVVTALADSGPAAWTGKQFGGSPEVMEYLGGPRYKKGPVLFFFVDDPENKIPLGPVEYNEVALPKESLVQT